MCQITMEDIKKMDDERRKIITSSEYILHAQKTKNAVCSVKSTMHFTI